MKSQLEYLSQYAYYHQNPSNVATHFVGIPMILVAITILLSRPLIDLSIAVISPAMIAALLASLFYLRLDRSMGVLMSVLLALSVWFSHYIAAQTTFIWLISGIGLFVVGWIFQFVGHYFEGKKPAFVDDIIGLIIGPLFVVVEALFLLGFKKSWQQQIKTACQLRNQNKEE